MPSSVVSLCLRVCAVSCLGAVGGGFAQETPAAKGQTPAAAPGAAAPSEFDRQSLAVRTALHYDPSLDTPLKSLISLYREADRLEELIGLYRGHIAQYAEDAGAKAVLIRLLRELNRAEADELVQSAIQQHPDNPLLNYLHYESRARRSDPRALESLARAVDLETKASLRDAWADRLLEAAGEEGPGRALGQAYLEKQRRIAGATAEQSLALADRMHRHGFHEVALATLQDAAKKSPAAETGVAVELLTARVQAALGDRVAAGARLDALLARLAGDHWRRVEIVSLRVGLLTNEADRTRLIDEARKRHEANPALESAALEYAELLAIGERRAEALAVLLAASESLPASERVERQVLALFDRLNDPKAERAYLSGRLERFPERADLRFRLVKGLFGLGRRDEATAQLDQVAGALPADELDRRLVELARHLRETKRFDDAAALFQRIVDAQPDRFEVRRELAEVHLAAEDRAAARAVLRDLPVNDAAIENFLDLVDFMVAAEFLDEARAALEARLEGAPGNLDLSLPLATVLAQSGDQARAGAIVLESRAAADTPARYRAWLEAALEVHEAFGDLERFYDDEQQRLLADAGAAGAATWTPERAERFLTYCELGEEKRLEARATQALRNQLADATLPPDLKLRLRRLLVKALERFPERAGEAEQQLQQLAKEDPARSHDYDLRRALLYHSLQRSDLARATLEKVRAASVSDVPVLKAAYPVFIEYGLPAEARRCLEKVTEAEPDDLITWEKRLSLLAAMGEEEELRRAIRQVLAGGDRVTLGAASIGSLKLHFVDSLWRSVSKRIGRGQPEALAEVPALLDTVDREAPGTGDRLWSLWARAYVLNARGLTAARDAVIQELTALAARDGRPVEDLAIAFPDGLSISLIAATERLREAPAARPPADEVPAPAGPLAAPELAWAYEIDPRARILQVDFADGTAAADVLILDSLGQIHRVDRATGKRRWSERFGGEGAADAAGPAESGLVGSGAYHLVPRQGGSISVQQLIAPYQSAALGSPVAGRSGSRLPAIKLPRRLVVDGGGRFYLPAGRQIEARSVEDGALAWSADLSLPGEELAEAAASGTARPEMQVRIEGDRVLAFVPETSVVAGLDRATGKLVWMRQLGDPKRADATPSGGAAEAGGPVFSLNSGASVRDGRLFVYGREAMILDTATGDALWRFDGGPVRTFPIELLDASVARPDGPDAAAAAVTAAAASRPGYLDHFTPPAGRAEAVRSFLQHQGALVAPATHWSAARLSLPAAASAEIVPGDRMLLFGEGGFRSISLRLPLASAFHPAEGVFLGAAGPYAWFLGTGQLQRVDLRRGNATAVRLDADFAGDDSARALLSGGRIYVIGSAGVRIYHAHQGSRIGGWAWPGSVATYRGQHPELVAAVPADAESPPGRVWQGHVDSAAATPAYCLPVRDRVSGDTLFAILGETTVVALRPQP